MDLFTQLFGGPKAPTSQSLAGAADTAKAAVPYALLAAEGYTNPSRLLGRLTSPQKTTLLKQMGLLRKMVQGSKTTSAINMAYGKRRNSYRKRSSYARTPSRKRTYGRRRRVGAGKKKNSTLDAIHKALLNRM